MNATIGHDQPVTVKGGATDHGYMVAGQRVGLNALKL